MTSSPSSPRAPVLGLLSSATSAGRLSPAAQDLMVQNLDDTVLSGCVGAPVDDVDAAEATLVSVLLDMSGSMEPHRAAVLDAYGAMLTSLQGAKAAGAILLSAWAFDDVPRLLFGYQPVSWLSPLGKRDYRPDGSTALYDATLGAMTGLVAYGQALDQGGVPTKRVLFVLSDGDDNRSRHRADDVRRVAEALRRDEAYTLAFAGFGSSDLATLAASMGFSDVLTTGATPAELRRIFRQVSASVVRVSQAAAGAGGGFF
jgi:hypothetical protein